MAEQYDDGLLKAWGYEHFKEIKPKLDEDYFNRPPSWPFSIPVSLDSIIKMVFGDVPGDIILSRLDKMGNVAVSDEMLQRLKSIFRFNSEKFQLYLKQEWGSLLDFYFIYKREIWQIFDERDIWLISKMGPSGSPSVSLRLMLLANAIVPDFSVNHTSEWGRVDINLKALQAYNAFLESKEKAIRDKVSESKNCIVLPFIRDFDVSDVSEKIIVTFHAERIKTGLIAEKGFSYSYSYDIDSELLKRNIVLLLSPLELDYDMNEHDIQRIETERVYRSWEKRELRKEIRLRIMENEFNSEFNAIGDLPNLERIKAKFNKNKWTKMPDYDYEPMLEARKFLTLR
ncbi:MAG: hypothetical protein ABSB40_05010 [Nitrososphaeria archaeon]|jgi:hypothetical protein